MKPSLRKAMTVAMLCLTAALPAHAMQEMSEAALSQTTGQSGAEITLDMRLNLDENGKYVCDGGVQFCRLALASNNRVNAEGQTKWLVMKGVHGQIKVQQLFMEGVTGIQTVGKEGKAVTKNGLKLTFNPEKPILIRNFGYEALSAEEDTPEQKAYLKTETFTGTGFDAGRETGVLGLEINANLQIGGTVKIFGIDK